MSTLFIKPDFVNAPIGPWQDPTSRPTVAGVYRIAGVVSGYSQPADDVDPLWSHYDPDYKVEDVQGIWGKGYSNPNEVRTARDGGCVRQQDRYWAGLASEPVIEEKVAGRVMVLQDVDLFIQKGVLLSDLVLMGQMWKGTITNAAGEFKVGVAVDLCSAPFMGEPPPDLLGAPQVEPLPITDDEI